MSEIQMLQAKIAELEAKVAAKKTNRALRYKVSVKGAVSVYGMGQFPVTLYAEQWDRLLTHAEEIKSFMADNKAALKMKGQELAA